MFRVSTSAVSDFSSYRNMVTQSRVQELQIQIASGKASQDYAGIAQDARNLLSLEETTTKFNAYQQNIVTTQTRLNQMETSVSQLEDMAADVQELLLNGLNSGNADDLAINIRAEHFMEQFAALMNIQSDGRYLFAGGLTDTRPVDLASFNPDAVGYDPLDPSTSNSGYYAGDDLVQSARVDTALTLDYGVTANLPAFEKLLRGLDMAMDAGVPGAVDTVELNNALELVQESMNEIPNIRSEIGASLAMLEQTEERLTNTQVYLDENMGEIENIDVAEAMTRLSTEKTQLESGYLITAQMQQIGLWNYLR
ncbi:flagellin [Rhodovibrionaceae bacterium A322]